jgi:hypothetical protein
MVKVHRVRAWPGLVGFADGVRGAGGLSQQRAQIAQGAIIVSHRASFVAKQGIRQALACAQGFG